LEVTGTDDNCAVHGSFARPAIHNHLLLTTASTTPSGPRIPSDLALAPRHPCDHLGAAGRPRYSAAMPTFTRKQLYEAVWSRPLKHIAEEHHTSYPELVRACETMAVPRPTGNHWTLVAMGKDVAEGPALPEREDVPTSLTLRRRVPRPRDATSAKQAIEPVEDDHPLLEATRKVLGKAKTDERGVYALPQGRRALAARVSPGLLDRALGIFALVIAAVESAGGKVRVVRNEDRRMRPFVTQVVIDGEALGLELKEAMRETRRKPTPEEKRGRYIWADTVREYHSTGRLTLALVGLENTGARQRWADSATGKVEDKVDGFVAAVRAGLETRRVRREEAAEMARRREAQRERDEARRREQARQQAICDQALQMKRHWTAARDLREFIDAALVAVPECLVPPRSTGGVS
jgi:hypothetical protein